MELAFVVSLPVTLAGWTIARDVLRPKLHKKRAHRSSAAKRRMTESAIGLCEKRSCRKLVHKREIGSDRRFASLGGWVDRGVLSCGGWVSVSDGIAAENFASDASLGCGAGLEKASEGTLSSRGSILLILWSIESR